MRKKVMLFLVCLIAGIGLAMAQDRTATGVVTFAEDGAPVAGASVMVKGTSQGTITDLDGNFVLRNIPSDKTTLTISFVGMETQEVRIQPGIIRITLEPDAELLDEVMVVAYGTAKRSSLTVGDIKNVIENFFDILPTFMLLGFTIKIDGLGTFRISFSSEGAETEDTKVTPDKMRSIRILFRPDADLRARILQEMEYERVTEGEVTVDPDDENHCTKDLS